MRSDSASMKDRAAAAKRLAASRESVALVCELGQSLPDDVVQRIYSDVVAELAAKAGLLPKKKSGEQEQNSA